MICDPVNFAHAVGRLDSWQQRFGALALPVAVIKKFADDGGDQPGVQVAYWGFFSVFAPLLFSHRFSVSCSRAILASNDSCSTRHWSACP
jgi:uncharacterized BrkB/YihY/UPF0761 family membrane protein